MIYLTREAFFALDKVVKAFEVPLRHFISDKMIEKYGTKNDFKTALTKSETTHLNSPSILSAKIRNVIPKLKKDNFCIYDTAFACHSAYGRKDVCEDVPYISELVWCILTFFDDIFAGVNITKSFRSIEEFGHLCVVYHQTRNYLSHPASHKVTKKDALDLVNFIDKVLLPIDDQYFWFASKEDIRNYVSEFMAVLGKTKIKINNLRDVDVDHKKIVCRENELLEVENAIFGKEEYCRVCGSLVLYGYGGVGKTAVALEFLHDVYRRSLDEEKMKDVEFLLFYSSKEEKLKTYKRTGEYYIDKAQKQIIDFESFKEKLFDDLKVKDVSALSTTYKRGIIVVDNVENLGDVEKEKLFEFINKTPRGMQFVLTSRNEEPCEDKIHVSEFRSHVKGIEFIRQYIEKNDLNVVLTDEQCKEIVDYSKGNTLIIVLSLSDLEAKTKSYEEIIGELSSAKSHGLETIADFMYKNTFEEAITFLEKRGYHPKEIINSIYLFDEDADLFSISVLTKLSLTEVDEVCKFLSKKLVLDKIGELYRLNDFAGSFIFVKMLPDQIEVAKLVDRINNHKKKMTQEVSSLDEIVKRNKKISLIMNDWKPRNYIDRILIAESFNLFAEIVKLETKSNNKKIKQLLDEFEKRSEFTNHPYVNFQKARMYAEYVQYVSGKERDDLINKISRLYEDAIQDVYYSYPFIKNTISHGALLMFFGKFLAKYKEDYSRSIRFCEDALQIFRQKPNKNIYTAMDMLAKSYAKMYGLTNDDAYKHKIRGFVREIRKDERVIYSNYRFHTKKFLEIYSKYEKN